LFGPVYVQHSALGPDGVRGLKGLVAQLPKSSSYQLVRVLGDGGLVVTEGLFTGFAPVPLTGYDVWRVVDGRIVEHWDALGPVATHSVADQTSSHGEAASVTPGDVAANKTLVSGWAEKVLVGGDQLAASTYLAADRDVQYDRAVSYTAIHAIIADGNLVYTRAEGDHDGPVVVNDVWRVDGGRIVEHWGLIAPVPQNLPHDNGPF
jgi:predicted SnoaL-like aldol condensation-catalyzing enzyme